MKRDGNGNAVSFDEFPVLRTDRLVLREITEDDAEFWLRNFSDPDVVNLTAFEPPKDLDSARAEIREYCLEVFRNSSGIRWGITLREDGRLIGTAGFYRWAKENFRSAHMGYDMLKEFRRLGIMREALAEIIDFGFREMALHRVQVQTDPRNTPSIRLVEGLGFRFEGVFREDQYFRERWVDDACYSLLSWEWKKPELVSQFG